ncbi:MAG: DHH family phosphoesterase [Patescibacteria group bacterium]
MDFSRIHKEINYNIDRSKNILLVIHQNPDGDAIGAGLSLANYLKREKRKHTLFALDCPSGQFDFLPFVESVETNPQIFSQDIYDTILVLDSGDLMYAGVQEYFKEFTYRRPLLVNIDHHHTNQMFGDLNLVDPGASSTSEILFNYFDDLRISVDKEMATCLLTGILLDTGAFTNPATNIASLRSASKLLIQGADLKKIVTHVLKNKQISTLKLWGRALSRLKKNQETGFITTIITQKDLEECQTDDEGTEGVANFLNNLSDTKAVLVLREVPGGKIKGSLRSTDDLIDVSKIATMFGGGGHKKAAGFTVKGKLKETANGWQIV